MLIFLSLSALQSNDRRSEGEVRRENFLVLVLVRGKRSDADRRGIGGFVLVSLSLFIVGRLSVTSVVGEASGEFVSLGDGVQRDDRPAGRRSELARHCPPLPPSSTEIFRLEIGSDRTNRPLAKFRGRRRSAEWIGVVRRCRWIASAERGERRVERTAG